MARPVKHRNKWRIRWLDADGNRRSEVYERERDAALALRRHQVEAEEIRRGLRPRPASEHTFADLALADYWREHRAPGKRSAKDDESMLRRHLTPAFGPLALGEITVERADAFAKSFPAGEKTLHNVLTLLIAMLNCAVDLGWLERCPRIKKPRVQVVNRDFAYLRTDAEIGRLLDAAHERGADVHALYATAIFTGMRAGELAGLLWSDVDLERRLITVQRSYDGPTKAGYIRHVPILDRLLPILRAWRLRCGGSGIVFPNQAGAMHQPSARVFQETFREVLKTARLNAGRKSGITFHGLRHTFASHWMMTGGDLFKLQRIAGWKSFAMVQRYAHLAPDAFASVPSRILCKS